MAKFFRTHSSRHPLCCALQKSEDIIVAAAYLDLKAGATDKHAAVLKALDQFWLNGHGLSDRTLILVNDLRRSDGHFEISFVDGHSSTYSLARREEKARYRKDILIRLQETKEFSPSRYMEVLERARAAARLLPTRDPLDFAA